MAWNVAEADMGPQLQREVERQLLEDLQHYGLFEPDLVFDWSESCNEGHCAAYLDGRIENWSGIAVRNRDGEVLAEGWLEFLCEVYPQGPPPLFLVYWEFLDIRDVSVKDQPGVPSHIIQKIHDACKDLYIFTKGELSQHPEIVSWREAPEATHESV
jgi:hypothetical protein